MWIHTGTVRLDVVRQGQDSSLGGVMNRTNRTIKASRTIGGLAASAQLDQPVSTVPAGFLTGAHVAASRQLFAAPPVDLTTLVIAEEIRRKAQAELQREVLRDTAYRYDMPVRQERNNEHDRNAATNAVDGSTPPIPTNNSRERRPLPAWPRQPGALNPAET